MFAKPLRPRPLASLCAALLLGLALTACQTANDGPGDGDGAPTTGTLQVNVSGVASGSVTVTGPAGYRRELTVTTTLTDLAPGAYVVSAAQVDEDGRLVQWNRSVSDLLGLSERDLRRTHALKLVVPEDREAVRRAMAEALEHGCASFQARALARDGHTVPFYVAAARVRSRGRRFLAGVGIEIIPIPGSHATMLTLPHVEKLAGICRRLCAL
mgnify:CR=1 FL=1